jgi:hypothetical protein
VVHRRPAQFNGAGLIAPVVLSGEPDMSLSSHATLVGNPELVSGLAPPLAEAFGGFAVVQSEEHLKSMISVGVPARSEAYRGR